VKKRNAVSIRRAGGQFNVGDLVRCRFTKRVGLVIDIYSDIYIPELSRRILVDVKFPGSIVDSFSPVEIELVEASD